MNKNFYALARKDKIYQEKEQWKKKCNVSSVIAIKRKRLIKLGMKNGKMMEVISKEDYFTENKPNK